MGFSEDDLIDLENTAYDSNGRATLDPATDVLAVTEDGVTIRLQFAGALAGDRFNLSSDNPALPAGGGTDVTVTTPCFCRGTRIQTDHGEVAVERLRVGDRLTTASGANRPLVWIGRRSHAAPTSDRVLPVLIRAGALADGVPRRDLHVSPDHAMLLDGVLVQAGALVNGVSIVQARRAVRVEYFHLELETHDIIFAEGAPTESYLDTGNRAQFANCPLLQSRRVSGQGDAPADLCAELVFDGPRLLAVKAHLDARIGLRRAA